MSRLLDNSKAFRDVLLAKNSFNVNDEYVSGHKNALSDGDEKGKGEKDGSIGSATDISKRVELSAKNLYNSNDEYNASKA